VPDVDNDSVLVPARPEGLVGTGDDFTKNPEVLDEVNAGAPVLTTVAVDNAQYPCGRSRGGSTCDSRGC